MVEEIAKAVNRLYDIAGDAMSVTTPPFSGEREIFFADRSQFLELSRGREIEIGSAVHVGGTEYFVHFECDGVIFTSIQGKKEGFLNE